MTLTAQQINDVINDVWDDLEDTNRWTRSDIYTIARACVERFGAKPPPLRTLTRDEVGALIDAAASRVYRSRRAWSYYDDTSRSVITDAVNAGRALGNPQTLDDLRSAVRTKIDAMSVDELRAVLAIGGGE